MDKKIFWVFLLLLGISGPVMAQNPTVKTKGSEKAQVQTDSVPHWVLPAPPDVRSTLPASSMHNEFLDEQVWIERNSVTHYNHLIRVVDQADGLNAASEVQVPFDPSYQSLIFHTLKIWRNGIAINKLDRNQLKLIQREPNLERQLYDGKMTAMLMLDDLRVGDHVEIAFSLKGMNPVFENMFVYMTPMASFRGPTKQVRFRLLAPVDRKIQHREGPSIQVAESEHDGMRETVFTRFNVSKFHVDQFTPASTLLDEQLSLSEFADWNAVSLWGEKLFAEALGKSSPIIQEAVNKLGAGEGRTPSENLQIILDFVQNQVRYFGTEIGESSHRPSSPAIIVKRRFGDCKDKVALLIAMLREVGIAATPVLVSTSLGEDVVESFSTPLYFNHVIARVELESKTYWLDGTRQSQTGPLSQREAVGLGKGLLLSMESTTLSELPKADEIVHVAVEETYRMGSFSEHPVLELRTTYFGGVAEILRQAATTQPLESLEQDLNRDLLRFHSGMEKLGSMKLEEVEGQNAVSVVQSFRTSNFWRIPENSMNLVADIPLWGLIPPLRHPGEAVRSKPFKNGMIGLVRHSIKIEFPQDIPVSGSGSNHFRESDKHLAMAVDSEVLSRHCMFSGEIHVKDDLVTPADWPEYRALIERIDQRLSGRCIVPSVTVEKRKILASQIEEIDNGWDLFNKTKLVTPVQKSAWRDKLIATAMLEGGRLPPNLKVERLLDRGESFDTLGQPKEAWADFDAALKLEPNQQKVLSAAATNAFALSDDDKAIEYANKALLLKPSDNSARDKLIFMAYIKGDYAEAKRHITTILRDRQAVDHGYVAIWLYLTAKRTLEDAEKIVKPYLGNKKSEWPRPILDYLMGASTWEQAQNASLDEDKDPSKLCELYYYAGEKALIEGRNHDALDLFSKSINTGVFEFNEYSLSLRRKQQLNERQN